MCVHKRHNWRDSAASTSRHDWQSTEHREIEPSRLPDTQNLSHPVGTLVTLPHQTDC